MRSQKQSLLGSSEGGLGTSIGYERAPGNRRRKEGREGGRAGQLSEFVLEHRSYKVHEKVAAGIVGGGAGYLTGYERARGNRRRKGGRRGNEKEERLETEIRGDANKS